MKEKKLFLLDIFNYKRSFLKRYYFPGSPSFCLLALLFLILLITTIEINSQSGRAKSLEIGNRWIYEVYDGNFGEYNYVYYTVIGDTLINDKIYAIIKKTRSNSSYSNHLYQRANDTIIYSYSSQLQSDEITIDFSLNVGDSLNGYEVINKYTLAIWSDSLITMQIYLDWPGLIYYDEVYVEKIGLIWKDVDGVAVNGSELTLLSAMIEDSIYGDPILLEINEVNNFKEKNFVLSQNYPNPFNPVTKIKFTIPVVETLHATSVELEVYDVLGNEVATLVDEYKPAGSYEVEFNATKLSSGIYLYKLTAGDYIETKKMVVLK